MLRMTPTARTLTALRRAGWTAAVVERRLPRCFTTVDLFGCIDIVAIRSDRPGVLGVQTTTRSNQAARLTKALAVPELCTWLQAGNTFWIYGWAKVGARGKRKLWEVATREVTLADLQLAAAAGGLSRKAGAR
jgi:hypothetical protein